MKNTTVLLILCASLAACPSPDATPVPTPVDMEYNVNVETLEDTCGNDPAPEELIVTLNVGLQADDSMSISYPTKYVPGPEDIPGHSDYKGLVIYDGVVAKDFKVSHPSTIGSGDDVYSIVGNLTQDSADLVIEKQGWRMDGTEEPVPCVRKVHMHGTARPFWTAALDGKYEADYIFYGGVCPPDPLPPNPFFWTVPLDIKDHGNSVVFAFDSRDENLMFEMPTEIIASGNVNWFGLIHLVSTSGWYEFKGSVVGAFMDGGAYSLRMDFNEIEDSSKCEYVLKANGAKHAPDLAKVQNVYRLALSKSDTCVPDANGNPTTKTFEEEGAVVFRTETDELTLMHGNKRIDLSPQADGTYTGHWQADGATLDYAASVVPPKLSFSYAYGLPTQNGTCRIAYEAVGVPRYFPDLALDPPKMPDAKTRLTRPAPGVAEESEPRSLGLATILKDRARSRPLSEAPAFVREAIKTSKLRR